MNGLLSWDLAEGSRSLEHCFWKECLAFLLYENYEAQDEGPPLLHISMAMTFHFTWDLKWYNLSTIAVE